MISFIAVRYVVLKIDALPYVKCILSIENLYDLSFPTSSKPPDWAHIATSPVFVGPPDWAWIGTSPLLVPLSVIRALIGPQAAKTLKGLVRD